MSNIDALLGIGEETLLTDNGEIIAKFVNGNFSNKMANGSKEVTITLEDEESEHEEGCGCSWCGYKIEFYEY